MSPCHLNSHPCWSVPAIPNGSRLRHHAPALPITTTTFLDPTPVSSFVEQLCLSVTLSSAPPHRSDPRAREKDRQQLSAQTQRRAPSRSLRTSPSPSVHFSGWASSPVESGRVAVSACEERYRNRSVDEDDSLRRSLGHEVLSRICTWLCLRDIRRKVAVPQRCEGIRSDNDTSSGK